MISMSEQSIELLNVRNVYMVELLVVLHWGEVGTIVRCEASCKLWLVAD
jgi:hypothetical protein